MNSNININEIVNNTIENLNASEEALETINRCQQEHPVICINPDPEDMAADLADFLFEQGGADMTAINSLDIADWFDVVAELVAAVRGTHPNVANLLSEILPPRLRRRAA